MNQAVQFWKGHGTGNDFVLVLDPDGDLGISAEGVRAVCDRRFGVGGDGLIRVVRSVVLGEPSGAEWFMDYRNADGSTAEMCGNGARVFARLLVEQRLVTDQPFAFGTRGGDRTALVAGDSVSVSMGVPRQPAGVPRVRVGDRTWPAVPVFLPNPHAVVFVDDLSDAGELRQPPEVIDDGLFPAGTNVEFVVIEVPGQHIALRVYERGVGETLSCGTGICAAAHAARARGPQTIGGRVVVDVPGGQLTVDAAEDGDLTLTGPAVLVASGRLSDDLSEALRGR